MIQVVLYHTNTVWLACLPFVWIWFGMEFGGYIILVSLTIGPSLSSSLLSDCVCRMLAISHHAVPPKKQQDIFLLLFVLEP